MLIITGGTKKERTDKLLEIALSDPYCAVLLGDVKEKNRFIKAGVDKERVFAKTTVNQKSIGVFLAPPHYLMVDDARALLSYYTGQAIGVITLDDYEGERITSEEDELAV